MFGKYPRIFRDRKLFEKYPRIFRGRKLFENIREYSGTEIGVKLRISRIKNRFYKEFIL